MNNNENKTKNEREKLEAIVLATKGRTVEDHKLLGLAICSERKVAKSIAIAEKLIHSFGGIGGVINADHYQLRTIDPGITDSMVARIYCIKEIPDRILKGELKKLPVIDNKDKLKDYLKLAIGQSKKELLRVMYLNQSYHLIYEHIQDFGTIDRTPLYIREVIEMGFAFRAKSIIIAHNHPSGDVKPSEQDKENTLDLALICGKVGIEFIDHIIVTAAGYFSFKENKLL